MRELVALIAIPILLGAIIWAPAWVFAIVVSAAIALAAHEMLKMARSADIPCPIGTALIGVVGLLAASWWLQISGAAAAVIVITMALPTIQLAHPNRPRQALSGAAVAVFTSLYLGLGGACLLWLRQWPEDSVGIRLIILFLVSIWVGDSGAYYVGKNFGRHRMSPRISPKKTWEGLLGGATTTFVACAAADRLLGLDFGWAHVLGLTAILAVAAPVGDLIESQFKRDTGVKDSSSLLPGHGGLLDRTDSLVYSAPPVLAYLVLTGLIR